MNRLGRLSKPLLLILLFLSATVLADDETYTVGEAATRRVHAMGQSWKIPVYNTSGKDVVMFPADHPALGEISRALGKDLHWSGSKGTLYGEDGKSLKVNGRQIEVDGRDKTLELPAQKIDGKIYVPSTALDGLLNCRVTVKPGSRDAIYVEPVLQKLSFKDKESDSVELLARTSVPVRKKVFTLHRPARTVVDLVGVAVPKDFESIQHPVLGEIRVGQFQSAPSIARIVIASDSGIKVKTERNLDLFEHQLSIEWPKSIRPIAQRDSAERVETIKIAPTKMPDRVGTTAVVTPPTRPTATIRPAIRPVGQTPEVQAEEKAPTQKATSTGRPLLTEVEWEGRKLKLTFSEPVSYRWSRVGTGTDRFVVDFPGVIFPRKKQQLSSSVPGVQGVRVVQNMPEPQPIVRLVCDMGTPLAVEAEGVNERVLVLEFPGHRVSAGSMPQGMGHTSQKIAQASAGGRTIVIDAGHGGSDPGALNRSYGVNEKTVTLDISLKLAGYLKAQGWNVIMTRSSDRDVSWAGSSAKQELGARANVGNQHGADLFVSVHANASVNPDINGTSIHWYKASDYRLAQLLESNIMTSTGRKNRGLVKNRFYVLAHTEMPAVLIETAFLTNATEGKLLADPAYRDRIARGIAAGLQVYASRTFPVASAKK